MRTTVISAIFLGCSLTTPAIAWDEISAAYDSYKQPTFLNTLAKQQDNAGSIDLAPASIQETQAITPLPKHLSVAPEKDWDYLIGQSYTVFGLSLVTVGLMTLLPESVTSWDEEDRNLSNLGSKWWDNVKNGPEWDKDDHFLNYIMHPYFGGVYYTSARHAGFDEWESFLYSATLSTFFWECGVEAFAEVPSIQDIIVTPIFGAGVGEWMFQVEADILSNRGEVMGSQTLGNVSLFFLNPVGHIHYWVGNWWEGDTEVNMIYTPWFGNTDAAGYALDAGADYDPLFIGLNVELAL